MRSAHSRARICKKYKIIFWACGKYGGKYKIIFWACGKYGGENGYRVEDLGADERIILKGS